MLSFSLSLKMKLNIMPFLLKFLFKRFLAFIIAFHNAHKFNKIGTHLVYFLKMNVYIIKIVLLFNEVMILIWKVFLKEKMQKLKSQTFKLWNAWKTIGNN